jgi:hypothetical protein
MVVAGFRGVAPMMVTFRKLIALAVPVDRRSLSSRANADGEPQIKAMQTNSDG